MWMTNRQRKTRKRGTGKCEKKDAYVEIASNPTPLPRGQSCWEACGSGLLRMHSKGSALQLVQLCFGGGGGVQRSSRLFFRTGATTLYSDERFGGGGVREQTSWCVVCLGVHAFRRFLRVSILRTCASRDARRLRRLFFRTHRSEECTLLQHDPAQGYLRQRSADRLCSQRVSMAPHLTGKEFELLRRLAANGTPCQAMLRRIARARAARGVEAPMLRVVQRGAGASRGAGNACRPLSSPVVPAVVPS